MNLKKQTMKDRWGNTVSYEFESPVKPIDQTALMKQAMEDQMGMGVPPMQAQGGMPPMPGGGHPGAPRGPDTVPAWLTPGEFVMNAEATRMFPQQIEQMNNAGRAVQRQQGGTIPQYKANGGEVVDTLLAGGITPDRLNELGWQTTPGPAPIQGEHIPYGQEFDPVPQPLNAAQRVAQVGGDTALGYAPPPQQPEEPGFFDRAGSWIDKTFNTIPEAGTVSDPTLKTQKAERLAGERTKLTDEVAKLDALEASGISPELLADKRASLQEGIADIDAQPAKAQEQREAQVQRIAKNRIDAGDYDGALELINKQKEVPEVAEGVPQAAEVPQQRELPPGFVEDANQNIPEAPVTSDPEGVAAAETAGNEQRQTPEGEGFFQQVFSSMKEQFKDVFTPEEIAKYATLYLGSRALGGSHDGSLAYIGQQFNAARQGAAAQSAELAKEGRELEQYKQKKLFDAQLAGQGPADVATDLTKTHAYGEGRTAVKQVVDQGNNKVTKYIDSETGEVVSPDQFTDQRFVQGTQENLDFQKDVYGAIDTVTDEIYKRDGRVSVGSYGDGSAKYQDVGDLTPEQVKTRFVDWAHRNEVADPTQLRTIYERSLKDYYGDAKFSGGKRSTNFEGFVNNQFIRAVGGQRFQDAFTLAPGKPGQPRKLADMEKATEITRAITSNINISNPRFKEELDKYGGKGEAMVQTAVIDDMLDTYKGISPSDLSFYKRLAKSEGETPEMAFMRVQLNLYPLGNIKTKPKQYYQ